MDAKSENTSSAAAEDGCTFALNATASAVQLKARAHAQQIFSSTILVASLDAPIFYHNYARIIFNYNKGLPMVAIRHASRN